MLDPDVVSLQSCSAPLLELSNPNAAAVNNGPLGSFRQEELQKPKYFQGWRMGVTLCAATTGTVLVINVLLTVSASIRYGVHGGFGTIQEGSCRITRNLSLWLHLAINILSTLLLGASNYCMQCLASPTREEIDIAHGQHVWLDIGVPSVRNLRRITPFRLVLWLLLAASSLPLHLLWNSAVFSTLSSQDYVVVAASPDLSKIAGLNWSAPVPGMDNFEGTMNYPLQSFRNAASWDKLDNEPCIKAYGQEFVSARGDLLLISSGMNASVPLEAVASSKDSLQPYSWICSESGTCNINSVLVQSANWTITTYADATCLVQHCLSKPVEERCMVQFSVFIMIIVIGCNFLKASCMLSTLWLQKSQPLVTLGDAIHSFLKSGDPTTENMCLAGNGWFSSKIWEKGPIEGQGQRYRWFSSASRKRWLTCNVL